MFSAIQARWHQPNGYGEVLKVGLPLVVSMGSTTIMEFTDRVFLSHYSVEAIAAATPATLVNLVALLFFIGVGTYVNVFIAQYFGSKAPHRVGAALWQAIYFSLFGAVVLASMYFIAEPLFRLMGHDQAVFEQEVIYFRILTVGSGFALAASSIGCFFSGRGITKPNMVVNIIATIINIPLDYMLIYGVGPFPEMGIAGAGLATASSWAMQLLMYCWLVFTKDNDRCYHVLRAYRFDKELFVRMMRYGLPSGVNYFFELFAVAFFAAVIGQYGTIELAASNMAFALNTVAFLPLIGLNIAISTLVGQAIGRGTPEDAEKATSSTIHIALAWMLFMAALFFGIPEILLGIFYSGNVTPQEAVAIKETGIVVMRFIAFYCLFDALTIVYFGAVKGAGDTHFVMWAMIVVGLVALIVPVLIARNVFDAGFSTLWFIFTCYISTLALTALFRFKSGRWKNLRLVETAPPPDITPVDGAIVPDDTSCF